MNLYDMTDTWNASGTTFTAVKMDVTDTASASGSLLLDLQVGGSSKLSVRKTGQTIFQSGTAALPAIGIADTGWGSGFTGLYYTGGGLGVTYGGGAGILQFSSQGLEQNVGSYLSWTSGSVTAGVDLSLFRDAANTLAQRRGTNAQAFRVYNTYTDASNYERGKIEWASNVLRIGTEKAGTGTARALEFQTDGTTKWTIGTAAPTLTASGGDAQIVGAGGDNLYLGSANDDQSGLRCTGSAIILVDTDNDQTDRVFSVRRNSGAFASATPMLTARESGSVIVGDLTAALATNATDGFLYVPTCAGAPTGTPTAETGTAPIIIDTTNNKLYFYSGGQWRDAGP
jgi:hypothetical protein